MHRFHAPILSHEFGGEPVEQLRMRRRASVAAKIRRRRNDAPPKMPQPEVVHGYSRSERVVAICHPTRKRQTASGAGRRIGLCRARFVGRDGSRLKLLLRISQSFVGLCSFLFCSVEIFGCFLDGSFSLCDLISGGLFGGGLVTILFNG